MDIPLFSPIRANEALLPLIQAKISELVSTGNYILGPAVASFENNLAAKLGFQHAVACSSGTDALILGLKALGLEPGDEVITPAFSFVASANAVAWIGCRPVFADVDLETGCVSAASVAKVMTPKTKAVMAVDLYGRQAPIAELKRLCTRQGFYLLEDGAQSVGTVNRGADVFATSFYPTKNLGAMGDAGAVLTDNPEIAARIKEMSRHGGVLRDHYLRLGTNGRMDTLQAGVLDIKLPRLDGWTSLRRTLAEWYFDRLSPLQAAGHLILPKMPTDPRDHVWALYTVRVPEGRAGVIETLRKKGVGTGIYYPKALPDQPSMQKYRNHPYPNAARLAQEVLSLPLYPELSGKEFEFVVKTVAECWPPQAPPKDRRSISSSLPR